MCLVYAGNIAFESKKQSLNYKGGDRTAEQFLVEFFLWALVFQPQFKVLVELKMRTCRPVATSAHFQVFFCSRIAAYIQIRLSQTSNLVGCVVIGASEKTLLFGRPRPRSVSKTRFLGSRLGFFKISTSKICPSPGVKFLQKKRTLAAECSAAKALLNPH